MTGRVAFTINRTAEIKQIRETLRGGQSLLLIGPEGSGRRHLVENFVVPYLLGYPDDVCDKKEGGDYSQPAPKWPKDRPRYRICRQISGNTTKYDLAVYLMLFEDALKANPEKYKTDLAALEHIFRLGKQGAAVIRRAGSYFPGISEASILRRIESVLVQEKLHALYVVLHGIYTPRGGTFGNIAALRALVRYHSGIRLVAAIDKSDAGYCESESWYQGAGKTHIDEMSRDDIIALEGRLLSKISLPMSSTTRELLETGLRTRCRSYPGVAVSVVQKLKNLASVSPGPPRPITPGDIDRILSSKEYAYVEIKDGTIVLFALMLAYFFIFFVCHRGDPSARWESLIFMSTPLFLITLMIRYSGKIVGKKSGFPPK